MTEEQELRRDLWLMVHFALHGKDFQEALRSRYSQTDIDVAIKEIEQWFKTFITSLS